MVSSIRSQIRSWHWIIILSFLFFFSIAIGAHIRFPYTKSITVQYRNPVVGEQYSESEPQPDPVAYPVRSDQSLDPPDMSAQAILVEDLDSGTLLYGKNEKMQLWPASTTKVMTAVIAAEEYDLNDTVTVSAPITEGSTMGLIEGEQIVVKHLVQGALIQSANDAAYALAAHHEGGVDRFVQLMNEKAVLLGLENTHFFDPAGFDHDKQFTTVSDLAKLTAYALKNDVIRETVATPLVTVSDVTYTHFHRLQNVNQLLGKIPGVAGVKTGWTENAKENLINLTKRDGHQILTVVLGSDDRFGETVRLTDWAFTNHTWVDKRRENEMGQ